MTAGLNSLAVNSGGCTGRSNLNVLNVSKLSKSRVSPNLLAIVAYPVLYVTVLGAGRSLCRYVLCRILKRRNGKASVVGDNGACCVKIVYVAVSTVPVLSPAGVVTTCLNALVVNSVSCAGSADSNRHLVCLNGAFSIKPSITAIGAIPVLSITELGTGRSLSLYVYDGVSCIGIGLLEALHTYFITGIEVGVNVSIFLKHRKNYCKKVGVASASLVKPCLTTLCTVPVLKVTVCGSSGSLSLNVSCLSVCHSDLNILNVGKLSKSLISPNLLTLVAYPILYVTVLIAGSCLSRYILCGRLKSGNCKALVVGDNSACCVKIVYVTVSTVPVLSPAGVVTTGLNALAVNSVSCAGSTESNRHLVCLNGAFSIKPSITAIGAIPVLSITELGTGRSLSLYVYDGVSCIGIGLLEALHTYLITGIEIGMYVRSLNGNSYCSALKGNGYGAAGGSNGVCLISGGICSTPIVVTNNLKCVGASRNIGVYLGVNAVSICHVVCGIAGIPLGAHVCAGACNGEGSLLITSGAKVRRIVCMTESFNYGIITILTYLSGSTGSSRTNICVSTGTTIARPCSATLIPCTCLNGIAIAGTVVNKVCGLIPLVIPVVSRCRRIHTAEDYVGKVLTCGNGNLIEVRFAGNLCHGYPSFSVSEEICCKACIRLVPVGIGNKIKLCSTRDISCACKDCCHSHEQCKYKHEGNKNFACVFHFVFSFLSFLALIFYACTIISFKVCFFNTFVTENTFL